MLALIAIACVTAAPEAVDAAAPDTSATFGFAERATVEADDTVRALASSLQRLGRATPFAALENRVGFSMGLTWFQVDAHFAFDIVAVGTPLEGALDPAAVLELKFELLRERLGAADEADAAFGILPLAAFPIGVSVKLGVRGGPSGGNFEGRLLAETHLGSFVLGLNVTLDHELLPPRPRTPVTHFEQVLGVGYALPRGIVAGFEVRNHSSMQAGAFLGDAIHAGPSFSWRRGAFYVAFAVLPQVASVKRAKDVGNGEAVTLVQDERFTGRLALGLETP